MRVLEMVMPFDRQAFFPETTDSDWAPHRHWLEPDALNPVDDTILLPMQSYVVRTSHHTILIDSCVGNDKERPTRPAWHFKSDETYMRALAAHGISPEDIDFVMCTHLHSDHIGWNTRLENGRWVPTFPNARYVFSEKELEAWRDGGHEKFSRVPYEDSVLPIVEAGRAQLVSNDFALDDEVRLEATPGHRCERGHVWRPDALSGSVPASRVGAVARLGSGTRDAVPSGVPRPLLRNQHAGVHGALPAAFCRARRARRGGFSVCV
jgi:hypothetical protein